jgi:hypothetical protein
MMRIRIFSSFCSTETATQNYKNIYGRDPGWFVTDDSYTHVIIINTAMPSIAHIPPAHVVGLAFEPLPYLNLTPTFIEYAKKYIGRYFIGDATRLPSPFESHYEYHWHKWVTTDVPPGPRHGVSLMVSAKKTLAGNKYRYLLANESIRHNLPVDIWGGGVPLLKQIFGNVPQLKDAFEDSVGTLLNHYKYSIAIENMQTESYVSEKFNDCVMMNTIPIYLGARRVDELYGEGCCVHLTGNLEEDIAIIRRACEDADPDVRPPLHLSRDQLIGSPKVNLFRAIEEGVFFGLPKN